MAHDPHETGLDTDFIKRYKKIDSSFTIFLGILFHRLPYVSCLLVGNILQDIHNFKQCCVFLVVKPWFDFNTILWMQLEIMWQVVDNNHFAEIPSNTVQVFEKSC